MKEDIMLHTRITDVFIRAFKHERKEIIIPSQELRFAPSACSRK